MTTGIPDMMARFGHEQNRKAAVFAVLLGLFFPLTGFLMMHWGGQGAWEHEGFLAWMGRFTAVCCIGVSMPKVYRFFLKASEDHAMEATGAVLAVEITALLATSTIIGIYALALQVIINVLVYSNSIAMDQKALHKAEREEKASSDTLHIEHKPVPFPSPKRTTRSKAKARKVVSLKTKKSHHRKKRAA